MFKTSGAGPMETSVQEDLNSSRIRKENELSKYSKRSEGWLTTGVKYGMGTEKSGTSSLKPLYGGHIHGGCRNQLHKEHLCFA